MADNFVAIFDVFDVIIVIIIFGTAVASVYVNKIMKKLLDKYFARNLKQEIMKTKCV